MRSRMLSERLAGASRAEAIERVRARLDVPSLRVRERR